MRYIAAIALASAFFLNGCANFGPLPGVLYSDYSYPGYYAGASSDGRGTKEGSAKATSFFSLISFGDASIAKATQAGSIAKIHTVDHHITNKFGIVEWTTKVTGE